VPPSCEAAMSTIMSLTSNLMPAPRVDPASVPLVPTLPTQVAVGTAASGTVSTSGVADVRDPSSSSCVAAIRNPSSSSSVLSRETVPSGSRSAQFCSTRLLDSRSAPPFCPR
jgi:hypothetical protein